MAVEASFDVRNFKNILKLDKSDFVNDVYEQKITLSRLDESLVLFAAQNKHVWLPQEALPKVLLEIYNWLYNFEFKVINVNLNIVY